jgi:DNA recombination protein RmuC
LTTELNETRSAAAVAASRLADLNQQHASQADHLRQATATNLELSNARERLDQQLKHAEEAVSRAAALEVERQRLQTLVTELTANHAALESLNQGLREQLVRQKQWVEEQTTQFGQHVLATAATLMEDRGKAFTETNKKEVDAVVAPFKEQLAEFRQRVDHIYAAENKDRGELKQQIVQLTSLNQAVSFEAKRLTNALTITSKSTGDWGETILQKILEDSGLREGHEYRLQHSINGAEGERLQPDAVVFLPGKRQLVVDSKVSNKAWNDYCAESDEGLRQERLQAHLASLRSHVKALAGKDYARSPDLQTVDFVLMFVPVEGALLTALATDDTLYTDAFRNKIILVTPSTLMAVVKLVEGIWTLQKRKESADEIAEAGRKLYEKLTVFAGTFVDVGDAIGKARIAFDKAQGQLSTGKGNAIRMAQRMVELGVSPAAGKTMPAALLGKEELDADDGAIS